MVFAVNALDDGPNTFEAFQALAKQQIEGTSSSARSSNDAVTSRAGVAGFVITTIVAVVTPFLL
jgi:hypothetical protein